MTEYATPKTFGNPPVEVKDVIDADGNTYCQVHTSVQTGLRCNNCERLMCAKCAQKTPVGYRCEQCVRQQDSRFFNGNPLYYGKIIGVTVILGALGAFIAGLVGFFLFVFFVAAVAGGAIGEAALRLTKGVRGRYAAQAGAAGVVVGTLLVMFIPAIMIIAEVSQTTSVTPELRAQLQAQYDAATVERIVAEMRAEQSEFNLMILQTSLSRVDLWLYGIITAVTVYGRLNIFGRRRN